MFLCSCRLTVRIHDDCFFQFLLLSLEFLDVGGLVQWLGRGADQVEQVAGTNERRITPRQRYVRRSLYVSKQQYSQHL